MDTNHEQLEFLISRAIDGDLSAEERARLDALLASDPKAQAEFDRMKRLNDLLGAWGQRQAPVDDNRMQEVLTDRIHDDVEFTISRLLDGEEQAVEELTAHSLRDPHVGLLEERYRRMEILVRSWGSIEPPVDHDRLHVRLCEMIHAEATRRRKTLFTRVVRMYAPLAAAAALVMAVGVWWFGQNASPRPLPHGPARVEIALVGPPKAKPANEAVMKFEFGLAPDAPIQTLAHSSDNGSTAIITVGSGQQMSASTSDDLREAIF